MDSDGENPTDGDESPGSAESRLQDALKQTRLARDELEARGGYGLCAEVSEIELVLCDVLDEIGVDTPHPHAGGGLDE